MDSNTTSTFDHRHYLIERFGLSVGDCESIFQWMNGIMTDVRHPLPPQYVATELRASAAVSADDHAKYGRDMSSPRHESSDMPAYLRDLAQKVGDLAPWQQDAIAFFSFGFWSGIDAAARERETTQSSHTVPQGWDKV